MNQRELALAFIRREVEETGELTIFAMRRALEHRISNVAMMAGAREGLRRRAGLRAATPPRPDAKGVERTEPAAAATPLSPQDRITEAIAQKAEIRHALWGHELLLADAKRSGMADDEIIRRL